MPPAALSRVLICLPPPSPPLPLQCDIAMLAVDDEEFWSGVQLLDISPDLPPMQQGVTVVGFPTGGDNVCVTKGVVSRLDRQQVGGVAGCLLVMGGARHRCVPLLHLAAASD